MTIYEKLSLIQAELKVTKDNRNDFGGFNYRSAEDILEAAKPICREHGTVLIIGDVMQQIGERYYIEARATLVDLEDDTSRITACAFAREEESKKGMDASQVTGATSSYARKYALNGLFNLDDNKDADTNEYTERQRKANEAEAKAKIKAQAEADIPVSKEEEDKLIQLIKDFKGKDSYEDRIKKVCKKYGVDELADLKKTQYTKLVADLSK